MQYYNLVLRACCKTIVTSYIKRVVTIVLLQALGILCGQFRRSVTLCLCLSPGGSRRGAHGRCESAGVHGAPEEAGRLLLHLMAPPSCDL